jgi:hypothetical protein
VVVPAAAAVGVRVAAVDDANTRRS